ncbi:MAG: spermidine synthase [Kangiellaceae bacterium]
MVKTNQTWIFLFMFLIIFCNASFAKELHRERSLYRNVIVTEKDDIRCMRFETRRKKISNQACINMVKPDELVFEYAHSVLSGLAFNPNPKNILVIGLGGGVLPQTFEKVLPNTVITSVEIDPAVVSIAKKYFKYKENERIKTSVQDGRIFIKRAISKNQTYDWIILDAFNGEYIPEHLLTLEFLQEVKKLLSPDGLLSANTFSSSELYNYESVTYQKVFNQLQILHSPTKGNRVIFACNCEKFDQRPTYSNELSSKLEKYNVNLPYLIERLSTEVDWDQSVEALTDQHSPANLLKR